MSNLGIGTIKAGTRTFTCYISPTMLGIYSDKNLDWSISQSGLQVAENLNSTGWNNKEFSVFHYKRHGLCLPQAWFFQWFNSISKNTDSFHLSSFSRSQGGCNSSSYYTLAMMCRNRKAGGQLSQKLLSRLSLCLIGWNWASHAHAFTNLSQEKKIIVISLE